MTDARAAVEAAYERIAADGRDGIWIELVPRERALAAASDVAARAAAGEHLPLAGRTLAVKGNIDVAGLRTTAGCPTYGEVPERSAASVRALEAAGAVVVGVTNLDQFATGLVGTRSPYGACPNAWWPELVSGGSSSGSAVAVAAGLVDLGLGTDTAGSGRVPAAANGIVGLKPTKGRISAAGVVPACRSLDCVSVFARSVHEATEAVRVASGFDPEDPWSRRAPELLTADGPLRLGRGTELPVDLDAVEVDLAPFLAAGQLLYGGAFVAERYDSVGAFVASEPEGLDPVVRSIVLAAAELPAWALARDQTELRRLRRLTEVVWQNVDVLVLPTVTRIPTVAEVAAEPTAANVILGTYTTFVNLLDLCALTLPVGDATKERPPPSITLVAPAWREPWLTQAAREALPASLARRRHWDESQLSPES